MYERCLNEAELILSIQQEPLVPVRKVWEEIVKRSKIKGFEVASLSDFSAMLDGDNRFQIVPAQIKIQDDEEVLSDDEVVDSDMGHLGFFSEDRVKLRSRRIVETIINEDEEEVGSIRRKAFAGEIVKSKKNIAVKKIVSMPRKKLKVALKNKSSNKKSKSIKQTKPARKTKVPKRGKK